MIRINLVLLLLAPFLFSLVLAETADPVRESNPFSSTYQLWSPIDDLAANSKVMPLYIFADKQVDLVVSSPNTQLKWYDNIRGLGKEFSPLAISSQPAAEFISIGFQANNSSDIVYVDKTRKVIIIATNPYSNGTKASRDNKDLFNGTWQEQIIFNMNSLPNVGSNLNSNWNQNYFISSILKVKSLNSPEIEQNILVSLEDVQHQKNCQILMLERTGSDKNPYTMTQTYSINSAAPMRIVFYEDIFNKGSYDTVVLVDGKLHLIVSVGGQGKVIKKISDIPFPTSYNFKHVQWVALEGSAFNNMVLMHPVTHQLGYLVNTWDNKGSSFPLWEFVEIVHYSLQIGTAGQVAPTDCVVVYPNQTEKVFDFLCVSDTDLRYYIQDQILQNATMPSNPSLAIQTNVFHDMPLHLIVWNGTVKHDQIFYLKHTETSAFILYSSSQGVVTWVERNKIELDSVGWTTNFWILIMIYCLVMSIIAGVVHTIVQNHLISYNKDAALLGNRISPRAGGAPVDIQMSFGPNRRTTV